MTYARPMFPPVDPTRRRFLSATAGLAAGGAALAVAMPPGPATAATDATFGLPVSRLDGSEASPALRAAAIKMQDASDALGAAMAAYKAQDSLAVAWQNQNPAPSGDPRKLKRWFRRAAEYRRSTEMRSAWNAQIAAEEAFAAAQMDVAMVKPRDYADLVLMSCLVFVIEEPSKVPYNTHAIARSVALNLTLMAPKAAS